ncbi:hypothetical protein [Pseudomonas sp. B15(2017)]|uniref:hypothetical protein n=1 Tax=Pseudomonas sp. B15(2017) TaxID=1981744 RepID=UPI000A1E7F74|nr:hypothetical protein [Pseudomonas sp. B15(2017)]
MTDYTGLKRLCAALISANEAYLDDSCSLENQERFHAADDALQDALPPEVVLAIIAENELLRESPGMGAIRSLRGDCADLMAECDRLKAANETLREDAERYRRMRAATLRQGGVLADQFDAEFDVQLGAAMAEAVKP